MPLFTDFDPDPALEHELTDWVLNEECYPYYVKVRRENCNFMELLNLLLPVPVCQGCALVKPEHRHRPPDISGIDWEMHLAWSIGDDAAMQQLHAWPAAVSQGTYAIAAPQL